MKPLLVIVIAVFVLSSCATQGLYNWDNYEEALFDYYHQPDTKDSMVQSLVAHLEQEEAKGVQPAPGLFAEAGTFYLLDGDAERAIVFYRKEADYWPESRPMMLKLIKNLEATQ